jgi:hypothetical protein
MRTMVTTPTSDTRRQIMMMKKGNLSANLGILARASASVISVRADGVSNFLARVHDKTG